MPTSSRWMHHRISRVGAGIARPQEAVSILQMVSSFGHDYKFAPVRRVTAHRDRDGIPILESPAVYENAKRFTKIPAEFVGSFPRPRRAVALRVGMSYQEMCKYCTQWFFPRADVGIGPYAGILAVRFENAYTSGGQCPPLRGVPEICKCPPLRGICVV